MMNLDNFFYYKLGASFFNGGHRRALIILRTLMLDSHWTDVIEMEKQRFLRNFMQRNFF